MEFSVHSMKFLQEMSYHDLKFLQDRWFPDVTYIYIKSKQCAEWLISWDGWHLTATFLANEDIIRSFITQIPDVGNTQRFWNFETYWCGWFTKKTSMQCYVSKCSARIKELTFTSGNNACEFINSSLHITVLEKIRHFTILYY